MVHMVVLHMVHMVVLHIDLALILRFFRRSIVGGEEEEEEGGGDGRKPPMAELVDITGVVVELVLEEVDIEAGRRQVETQAREVVVVGGDGGRNVARTPGGS